MAEIEPAHAEPTEPQSRVAEWIVGICLAVFVAACAGGWFWLTSGTTAEFDYGMSGYGLDAKEPTARTNADRLAWKNVDGDNVVEATGYAPLHRMEPIAIDLNKHYRVRARIRVVTDDPEVGGAITYVGVATYDQNGELQTEPPGTHRYAAMAKQTLKSEDGWVNAVGIISGVGRTNNQFRAGTTHARPVVLLNYNSPGAVSQITSMSIEELR